MQEEDERVFPVGVVIVRLDDQAPQALGIKLLCFHDSSEVVAMKVCMES